jgi:hypothetical protein
MHKTFVLFIAILAFIIFSSTTEAQEIKHGGLTGTIVSATTIVCTNGGCVNPIYTTPAEGSFVLTQFCATTDVLRVIGSSFGGIPVNEGIGCTTFSPGIALPQNETISCENGGTFGDCMITGVLSDK